MKSDEGLVESLGCSTELSAAKQTRMKSFKVNLSPHLLHFPSKRQLSTFSTSTFHLYILPVHFLTLQGRRFVQFASILPRALYFRYVIIKCCYWKTWSSHLKNAHHSNFNALITAHQSCWKQTYEVENVKYNKTNERLTIELQRWTLNVNRNSNVGKTQACLLQGPTPIQRGYHCCFRSIPCWRHYFFKGMRKIFNKFH